MSDATNPKPKRQPTGAAVAGAHPRPKRYPDQLVVSVSPAVAARIVADAERHGISKAEVIRTYLDAGIAAGEAEAAQDAAGRLAD